MQSLQLPSQVCSGRPRAHRHRASRRSALVVTAAGNSYGTNFRVTTFGESHGGGVGCVVDGVPPRLQITQVRGGHACGGAGGGAVARAGAAPGLQ